jgi:hypothetical protein
MPCKSSGNTVLIRHAIFSGRQEKSGMCKLSETHPTARRIRLLENGGIYDIPHDNRRGNPQD